jgi:glycosyltransferase involved in cell wall biosynthesis
MMEELSALVLTYNEEDHIADCLESISWIERIINQFGFYNIKIIKK